MPTMLLLILACLVLFSLLRRGGLALWVGLLVLLVVAFGGGQPGGEDAAGAAFRAPMR